MLTGTRIERQGWDKILQASRLAKEQGYHYVWVDTCCIDKTSSAELGEAINSMFQWYEAAAVCYAYLADLSHGVDGMFDCRWWTRGWTLQELLAPRTVIFYDATWTEIGTKTQLARAIEASTGIPDDVLYDCRSRMKYDVATKMSWASSRNTTRLEDEAYCLLGIFDINMPLIYGEGQRAFARLQEEILKGPPDLTILGFESGLEQELSGQRTSVALLARSPKPFQDVPSRYAHRALEVDVSIMNQQLRLRGDIPLYACYITIEDKPETYYALECTTPGQKDAWIPLFKIAPRTFVRCLKFSESRISDVTELYLLDENVVNILIHPHNFDLERWRKNNMSRVEVSWPNQVLHRYPQVQPQSLFDHIRSAFLYQRAITQYDLAAIAFMFKDPDGEFRSFERSSMTLVLLFRLCQHDRRYFFFSRIDNQSLYEYIFSKKRSENLLDYSKLERRFGPLFQSLSAELVMKGASGKQVKMTASHDPYRSMLIEIAVSLTSSDPAKGTISYVPVSAEGWFDEDQSDTDQSDTDQSDTDQSDTDQSDE